MSAGHTEGGWAMEAPMGEHCPWIVPSGKEAFEWEPIATLGDCTEDGPSPRSKAFKEIQANARLIVAACNSYDRHFGPRAIEAAEADLLGKALEALREIRRANPMNINGAIDSGTWMKIDAILSQEVK